MYNSRVLEKLRDRLLLLSDRFNIDLLCDADSSEIAIWLGHEVSDRPFNSDLYWFCVTGYGLRLASYHGALLAKLQATEPLKIAQVSNASRRPATDSTISKVPIK